MLSCGAGGEILASGCCLLTGSGGIGGTGRAWRGHDQVLEREVAVREALPPTRAPGGQVDLIARSAEAVGLAVGILRDISHLPAPFRSLAVADRLVVSPVPWFILAARSCPGSISRRPP